MPNPIIRFDPIEAANSIRQLGEEIHLSKQSFNELRDRSWWERTVSNNTKDLADGLYKQAEATHALLSIIQGVIFLNMSNAVELEKVSKGIKFTETGHARHLSEYEKLAADAIDKAIERSRKLQRILYISLGVSMVSLIMAAWAVFAHS